LPEPPAARWRRPCILWLEAALHKIAVAGRWLHRFWIVSIIGLTLVFVFGTEAVRRLAFDVYFVRTSALVAVALAGRHRASNVYLLVAENPARRPAEAGARISQPARAMVRGHGCLHWTVRVPGAPPQVAELARVCNDLAYDVRDRHSLVALAISRDRARSSAGEPGCAEGRRRRPGDRGDRIGHRRRLGRRASVGRDAR
jgi:hypothetical protein